LVVFDKKESIFFNIFSIVILVDEAESAAGPNVGSDESEVHNIFKDWSKKFKIFYKIIS
jgi:hypothetical protein